VGVLYRQAVLVPSFITSWQDSILLEAYLRTFLRMDLIMQMAVLLLHLEILGACFLLASATSYSLHFAYFMDSSFVSSFQDY
jgi:hypothetical protein